MLVKPAICLVLGIIANYFCSAYIFESEQFDEYMNFMLKDYENASAAFLGLIPEFIVFVNLIVRIVIHLFAILLFKLLKSSSRKNIVFRISAVFPIPQRKISTNGIITNKKKNFGDRFFGS